MGWVYLLVEIDDIGVERYKIGITKNDPIKRVKQLQTGNANLISVLRSYQSDNYRRVEQWLHKKYSSLKTEASNEWRALQPEHVFHLLMIVKKLMKR